MKDGILVDTSVIVDYLRIKDKRASVLFELAVSGISLCISIVTVAELYSGSSVWEAEEPREKLNALIEQFEIIPMHKKTAILAGKLRFLYKTDLIDSILAATSLELNFRLATLNKKHFAKIENLLLV